MSRRLGCARLCACVRVRVCSVGGCACVRAGHSSATTRSGERSRRDSLRLTRRIPYITSQTRWNAMHHPGCACAAATTTRLHMQVRQVRGFALESLRAATADGCGPCALVVTAELNTTAEASSAHTGIRVSVRACICACMHVCVVQAHTCTHTRAHTHVHARVYAHTRASGAERGG